LAVLSALTVAAIAMRVPSFSDSLYGDELSAYYVVSGHGVNTILDLVRSDQEVTPPLFFLVARLIQGVGSPAHSLRWVPFFSSVASVPLTYLLGTRTIGRWAGLVAAAIMAFSPFLIVYSTEARPYGLLMLLSLGSTLALLRAIQVRRAWWWALYALLSCAVMYTHYTGAFLLIGQVAWALIYHRGTWRWLVGANLAAAVGWLPWLSAYRADQKSPGAGLIGFLQPFGLGAFKTDVLHWAIGHPLTVFSVRTLPGDFAIALIASGLALGAVGIGLDAFRDRARVHLPSDGTTLVLILALSSPVLAGLYSAIGESVLLPRNLIASSPGLALALALVVTRPQRLPLAIAASAIALAGFTVAGARMLENRVQRPNYAAVVAFITDRGGSSATTVDTPELSPGPLTALDVAFGAHPGASGHPAPLRLGRAPQAATLHADRPGGPGQFAQLPVPQAATIGRMAVSRARRRPIFLVNPGVATFPELLGHVRPGASREQHIQTAVASRSDAGEFARGLSRGYRVVDEKVFPGLLGFGTVTVFELQRASRAR
jgi:hypothetical protein